MNNVCNLKRINEAFLGWLADHETTDIQVAYDRYIDVATKYGDHSHMAFPMFVDFIADLPYVKYENKTGYVHFLTNI